MSKNSRQKFKYLENEKSFEDKIKSIFHHFGRAIIEANKKFFGRWEPDFKLLGNVSSKIHFSRYLLAFLQYENFIQSKTAQYRDSLVDFAERRKKNHEEAAELLSNYLQELRA